LADFKIVDTKKRNFAANKAKEGKPRQTQDKRRQTKGYYEKSKRRQNMANQGKTSQNKEKQGKTRQNKAKQGVWCGACEKTSSVLLSAVSADSEALIPGPGTVPT
jgi:hypothetical protein